MATPDTWHDHAAAAIRKARRHQGDSSAAHPRAYQREERFVVRNAAGEAVRGGMVPPGGVIPLNPGEDIEIVPAHRPIVPALVRTERDAAWREGYRVGYGYGEMAQRAGPFGLLLAAFSGFLVGIFAAAGLGLFGF